MQSIPDMFRRAVLVLLVVLVALGVVVGEARPTPRRSPAPRPRGLEWRTIKRLPTGRIVALRLQVVIT